MRYKAAEPNACTTPDVLSPPFVVLEYLSAKRPILGTGYQTGSDRIRHHVNIWFFGRERLQNDPGVIAKSSMCAAW
jgi:hypothetical protein